MLRATSVDDGERKVLDDVARFGWHCAHVLGEHKHQPFSCTVGLFHSYRRPELLICGLPREVSHGVLSIAAEAAARGEPLNLSTPTSELLEGYPCVSVEVPIAEYPEHVGFARWYYEGDQFPVQQVVWPSKARVFPWHPAASAEFRAVQPVLGERHGDA